MSNWTVHVAGIGNQIRIVMSTRVRQSAYCKYDSLYERKIFIYNIYWLHKLLFYNEINTKFIAMNIISVKTTKKQNNIFFNTKLASVNIECIQNNQLYIKLLILKKGYANKQQRLNSDIQW